MIPGWLSHRGELTSVPFLSSVFVYMMITKNVTLGRLTTARVHVGCCRTGVNLRGCKSLIHCMLAPSRCWYSNTDFGRMESWVSFCEKKKRSYKYLDFGRAEDLTGVLGIGRLRSYQVWHPDRPNGILHFAPILLRETCFAKHLQNICFCKPIYTFVSVVKISVFQLLQGPRFYPSSDEFRNVCDLFYQTSFCFPALRGRDW